MGQNSYKKHLFKLDILIKMIHYDFFLPAILSSRVAQLIRRSPATQTTQVRILPRYPFFSTLDRDLIR